MMSKSSVDSQQRHVLFQGPHPWPRDQISKQRCKSAGQINVFLGSSAQTSRKIPSQCQPHWWLLKCTASEVWPPSLPLKSWFFPYFGGNLGNWLGWIFGASCADPANSFLWTLSLPRCQETYFSDICITAPAGTFCFGTSLAQRRRFCCGKEAAGCNVVEEYAIRHCCPHPQPRVMANPCHDLVSSEAGPVRGPRHEYVYHVARCD